MLQLGFAVYVACVDFLLAVGLTYRDANSLLFFLIWPLCTLILVSVVLYQQHILRRG